MVVLYICLKVAQYSILSIGSVSCSSVRQFPERSWTVVAFTCFTVVKSFTSWYALLLLFFLRFSFNFTVLLSSFFSLPFSCASGCCCSLPCISQILQVQTVSSQFSPSVAQIKNFCSDQGFFLLTMFAKDLTGCFSHCCVEGGDH